MRIRAFIQFLLTFIFLPADEFQQVQIISQKGIDKCFKMLYYESRAEKRAKYRGVEQFGSSSGS